MGIGITLLFWLQHYDSCQSPLFFLKGKLLSIRILLFTTYLEICVTIKKNMEKMSTIAGFEPARAEHNRFRVCHLRPLGQIVKFFWA